MAYCHVLNMYLSLTMHLAVLSLRSAFVPLSLCEHWSRTLFLSQAFEDPHLHTPSSQTLLILSLHSVASLQASKNITIPFL